MADEETGETLLAGKYKSEEELNKGVINKITQDYGSVEDFYKSLEKGEIKIGNEQQAAPKQSTEQSQQEDSLTINQEPVSFDKAKSELMESGEVSQATYDQLAQTMPKEALDAAINGVKAQKSAGENAVFEMAGGKEEYAKLTAWAKENLSAEDVKGFNDAITSGNSYLQKAALQSLQSAYQNQEGTEGERVKGDLGGESNKTGEGFKTHREMVEAMKDPRYKTDSAYRDEVQKKVAKSNL